MPMYHGKATDALATLSSKDITANPIADKAVLQTEAGDYKIVIQDFSKIKGKLSVNTHKLLSTGIAEFTQINNYGGGNYAQPAPAQSNAPEGFTALTDDDIPF